MKSDAFPLVSIVIINYNGLKWLEKCLQSITATKYPTFEIILVDNASSDNSVAYVQLKYPEVKLIAHERNLGYANGVNYAISKCKGNFIAVLNNDVKVDPFWLENLMKVILQDEKIGIVTPKKRLLSDPRFLDGAGGVQNIFGYGWDRGQCELDNGSYDEITEVLHPPGAAFVIQRKLVDIYGFLLNPDFFYLFEDADLGLRCWLAGYKVVYVPDSVVYHARGPSVGAYSYRTSKLMDTHVLASYFEVFGLRFMAKFFPLFFMVRFFHGLLYLKAKRDPTRLLALLSAIFVFLSNFPRYASMKHIVNRKRAVDSYVLLDHFSEEIAITPFLFPHVSKLKKFLQLTGLYIKYVIKVTPIRKIWKFNEDKFKYIHHKPLDEN